MSFKDGRARDTEISGKLNFGKRGRSIPGISGNSIGGTVRSGNERSKFKDGMGSVNFTSGRATPGNEGRLTQGRPRDGNSTANESAS